MRVPAAFRTPPNIDLGEHSAGKCACGSDVNRTYIVATVEDGEGEEEGGSMAASGAGTAACEGDARRRSGRGRGRRHNRRQVATPVLWCQRCRRPGAARAIGEQAEVRGPNFALLCAHCRGAMHRLFVVHGTGAKVAIPLSYCLRCVSVSFRAIAGMGRTRRCDLCRRAVPDTNRWCGGCKRMVDGWRRMHGAVPPTGDARFADVMRMVVEDAGRRGRGRSAGRRVCTSCRTEFDVSAPRQRRCGDCVAGQVYRGRKRGRKAAVVVPVPAAAAVAADVAAAIADAANVVATAAAAADNDDGGGGSNGGGTFEPAKSAGAAERAGEVEAAAAA